MKKINDWYDNFGEVLIASDHGGLEMKKIIRNTLQEKGTETLDLGPDKYVSTDDYSDYAAELSSRISKGKNKCGILICRSGAGMVINANRFHYVRAFVALNQESARVSRSHNCSNVLVLPADFIDAEEAVKIIETWLSTPFSNEDRHLRRIEKVELNSYDEVATIRTVDPEIAEYIEEEGNRQEDGLELIASENFASTAVQAAQGSILTNKYAEGYPGKRYYGGCEVVDKVELLGIERACKIFDAEAANVQPHSGSQANMAAYFALIKPGDTILAMDLAHGGHLTHGHPLNFSGMMYNVIPYGVKKDTETIDYDHLEELAVENKPNLIVAGASAYSRVIDFERLKKIADKIDAKLMVDMAHIAGLVAAGLHPNPVPYCDIVTTTTHKSLRGPRGGLILCKKEYLKAVNSKVFPGIQGGPLMHVIAAKAVCFKEAMTEEFKGYQKQLIANAAKLAEELVNCGFRIVSGGTDNHLMLVDLQPKKTTGKAVQNGLEKAGITVNKNMIPFDPAKPFITSGIRIGTPAVTTRGLKEKDMHNIALWISRVVDNLNNDEVLAEIKEEVKAFAEKHPMPSF
ncbi:MAG: serine hydroxymethyltransferase [Victivallales bacterium]|nr:serine hydroxymethyltransferase [Victivallales bacterium]MCF7888561.1 serine hydroxymethyltransferase [Victivallales bacterium]